MPFDPIVEHVGPWTEDDFFVLPVNRAVDLLEYVETARFAPGETTRRTAPFPVSFDLQALVGA